MQGSNTSNGSYFQCTLNSEEEELNINLLAVMVFVRSLEDLIPNGSVVHHLMYNKAACSVIRHYESFDLWDLSLQGLQV